MKKGTEKTVERPVRKLKLGFNMCTALIGCKKPMSDEEVYRLLSSKPNRSDF